MDEIWARFYSVNNNVEVGVSGVLYAIINFARGKATETTYFWKKNMHPC